MSEPIDKAQWILTPLHPEGISSTEYDKKFDKFLNPINWDSVYFTEAEFERLVQYSKYLEEKYKPLTEEQIQEILSKTFQKREDSVEVLTIDSLPYKAGGLCTVEILKSRLSVPVEHRVSMYDTESNYFSEEFLRTLNDALTPIVQEIDHDNRLYVSYLKLITKYIKGARNFNSRKAKRKIKCRRR